MSDGNPLDELGDAIEKAKGKGLIRGGSKKLQRRMQGRAYGMGSWSDGRWGSRRGNRAHRANKYLATRTGKDMFGATPPRLTPRGKWRVSKSVEALDAEIEKALRINGGVKVSPAQRRNLAVTNARGRGKPLGSGRRGKALYRDSAWGSGRVRGYIKNGPDSKYWRAAAGERIDAFRRKRGEASPYKRKLFGGLKRIKKDGGDIHKAKAKTLYVYRPVENAADIIAWAESQGFKSTQPAEKLHVTLAYSKTPLNWAMLHDDYHREESEYALQCECGPMLRSADGGNKRRKISGGVREVKALGSDGAVVLAFESDSLTQRWMDFKRAGAAWSFPSFTPHITISYAGKGVDLSKVHPYAGDIILGEECWEEVSENGQAEAIAAEKVTKAGLDDLNTRLAAVEAKQAEPAKEAA